MMPTAVMIANYILCAIFNTLSFETKKTIKMPKTSDDSG